jgi:hypothetical protein
MSGDSSGSDLLDLYLDWCSARVAERFLSLTPDEVWQRAVALGLAEGAGGVAPGQIDLARSLAAALATELSLPGYGEWSEAYARDPAAFAISVTR